MVVLHLFLVLERLRGEARRGGASCRALLVEAFVADMDDSLREMGTGDLAVPKKVRAPRPGSTSAATAYRAGARGRRRQRSGGARSPSTSTPVARSRQRAQALAALCARRPPALWRAQRRGEVLDGRVRAFPHPRRMRRSAP